MDRGADGRKRLRTHTRTRLLDMSAFATCSAKTFEWSSEGCAPYVWVLSREGGYLPKRATRVQGVGRAWSVFASMPRSHSYPVLGAVLALGAPVGLLLARALEAGKVPTLASAAADVE